MTASASRAAAARMPASDVGIRHQRPHGRIEEACHRIHVDAAAGENARQQFRHIIVTLRDRERARRAALVQPVAPGAAAGRPLDAEKEAPRRACRCGEGDRHLDSWRESLQKSLRYWMKPERSASLS